MPNVAATILSSGVNCRRAHDMNYLQCGPIVNVGLQAGQVPSLINNVLFSNLVSLCARLQGGLGSFLTFNMMGQWNPLQQIQVMQALQTLASLGVD